MGSQALVNGRFVTMDPALREPEVLLVEDGRIAAVGGRELLKASPVEIRDLEGQIVLPGFIDAHNHLSLAALHPLWADLSGASSLGELGAALKDHAAAEPDARWVRGANWSELVNPFPLTRRELDALGIDRPVLVAHFSYHQGVVNSAGLEELEIGLQTRDPEGGEIVRGPDGAPTGLLIERAWSHANAASIASYRNPERRARLIEERARLLLRHGITCVHDAACMPAAEAVYGELARSGRLPISVLSMPHPDVMFENRFSERLAGPPTGEGDERFRIGPMKFFADGGTGCAIDLHVQGERHVSGHAFPHLAAGVAQAVKAGFRVAVHAMGNVGMESALGAFEVVRRHGDRDHRFRLEHATLATPEQIRRLAAIGGVAVLQPGFLSFFGQIDQIGLPLEFDEAEWLPFRSLLEAGVALAASSDDPCGPVAPLEASCYGTTRGSGTGTPLGPKQGLPYDEWLRAYTIGAAYAGGQEDERGSLSPGKRADLVIVEGELDAQRPPTVVETWVGGRAHRWS